MDRPAGRVVILEVLKSREGLYFVAMRIRDHIAPAAPVRRPPGIFVISDGMGLVTKRVGHVPPFEPPEVVIKSANPEYAGDRAKSWLLP